MPAGFGPRSLGCWISALALGALALVGSGAMPGAAAARADERAIGLAFARRPLAFEPNRGQADPAVRFLARGSGSALLLDGPEAVLALAPQGGGSAALR